MEIDADNTEEETLRGRRAIPQDMACPQFIALVALCSKVRHQTGMAKMHIRV